MASGDLKKAEDALRFSQGANHYIADVVYSRMTYDLDASDRKSEECVRQAGLHDDPSTVFICRALAAGNDLMRGDIAGWANKLAQLKASSGKLVPGTSFATRNVLADVEDYTSWVRTPHSSVLDPLKRSYNLPLKHAFGPASASELPGVFVNVLVNGHPLTLSFDTGSFMSILSESSASAANISIQSGWFTIRSTNGAEASSSLGIAKKISIGGITLNQWSMAVLPGARFGAVGLDVISRLGPMLITYDGVRLLSREATAAIPCQQTIILSSLLTGTVGGLRFPITIDGKPHIAMLDTGSSGYLTRIGGEADEVTDARLKDIQTVNGRFTVSYAEKRVSLIAGPIHTSVTAEIRPGPKLDYEYALGSSFLKDANVFIDFSSHRACILPKEAGKSDASATSPDPSQSK